MGGGRGRTWARDVVEEAVPWPGAPWSHPPCPPLVHPRQLRRACPRILLSSLLLCAANWSACRRCGVVEVAQASERRRQAHRAPQGRTAAPGGGGSHAGARGGSGPWGRRLQRRGHHASAAGGWGCAAAGVCVWGGRGCGMGGGGSAAGRGCNSGGGIMQTLTHAAPPSLLLPSSAWISKMSCMGCSPPARQRPGRSGTGGGGGWYAAGRAGRWRVRVGACTCASSAHRHAACLGVHVHGRVRHPCPPHESSSLVRQTSQVSSAASHPARLRPPWAAAHPRTFQTVRASSLNCYLYEALPNDSFDTKASLFSIRQNLSDPCTVSRAPPGPGPGAHLARRAVCFVLCCMCVCDCVLC